MTRSASVSRGVEADHVEHDLDAAAQLRAQQSDAARAERARRAGSGEHGDRGVQLAAEGLVQCAELTVQLAHGGLVRALLRRKDVCRAAMAVHGIGDVAHGDHAHTVKPFAHGGGVDVRDAVECRADGNEGRASRVREADAQCRGAAAAAVVRGAAAEAEHDAPRAARKRIGDELSDAVGRGDAGFLRPATSGSPAAAAISMTAVPSGSRPWLRRSARRRVCTPETRTRSPPQEARKQSTVPSPPSATFSARTSQAGKKKSGIRSRAMAQMSRLGSEPLEGIGDHDALFHALCLPCGCFSYSICKPRAGCKSFAPQR